MSDIISGNSLIVAAGRHIEHLRSSSANGRLDASTQLVLPSDEPLPDAKLGSARVLVLEVDAASDASMRRLATIRAAHPDIVIIAAVEQAGVALVRTLIRQGVYDVAELPFESVHLEEQVLDALSNQIAKRSNGELGKAIAVIGAAGGCGATSVLTHLAAELAKANQGKRGVCLIDLDLQKGTVGSYLGIDPKVTIQVLIDAGARLDRELLLSAVSESNRGFSFIAAPEAISPIDRVDIDHLLAIVGFARAEFDYVLVDLPPLWTDWTLSLASWANNIILVTDTSIANLRHAKRTVTLMNGVNLPSSHISLAVNRMERKLFGKTRIDDVARALGRDEVETIADAGPTLREAQDQGLLLPAVQSKSKFASDIARLAKKIVSGDNLS